MEALKNFSKNKDQSYTQKFKQYNTQKKEKTMQSTSDFFFLWYDPAKNDSWIEAWTTIILCPFSDNGEWCGMNCEAFEVEGDMENDDIVIVRQTCFGSKGFEVTMCYMD